ncbi:MAG: hypothetical protein AAB263_15500, partial [Planctomycetota bacterium]
AADAPPALATAANGDREAGRTADAALERGERALDRMLSDSDLTRIIAQLIDREKALAGDTKSFVRKHLTEQLNDTGKAQQAELATRQRDLATKTGEAERRILAGPTTLDAAKEIVRTSGPGEHMAQAASDVASNDQRVRALQHQDDSIAALERILAALRGGDAAADLGRRLGELAEQQARLAEAIDRGENLETAQAKQELLRQQTERLATELKDKPDAQQPTQAAASAQVGAEKALSDGNRAAAARYAATAAELLRQAQKKVDPRTQPDQQQQDKASADVVALLRALYDQQTKVLSDSLPIAKRIGEDEPDFAASRDLAAIAQLQDDILLRLREEGIKLLDKAPIAKLALTRVDAVMTKVLDHVKTPALGESGLRLERIALYELKRLIDIADGLPQAQQDGSSNGSGNGGSQAPFPQAAELALLMAQQADIHDRVASGRPGDHLSTQTELTKLVGMLEQHTRPGSRPNVLLGRARRSTDAAAFMLKSPERGAALRNHMVAAEENLRQILLEAKGNGGSSNSKPPPPRPNSPDGQEPPPSSSSPSATPSQAAAGNVAPPSGTTTATNVRTDQLQTNLLQLPPERREQLRQAREQRLPAGALQLFERYLERLEEP